MLLFTLILSVTTIVYSTALNLNYLDPSKLQTQTPSSVQQKAALRIIQRYLNNVTVKVDPLLFNEKKDLFALWTSNGQLNINASSGVAAVWGFHYYLKKYCKSHIGWQAKLVNIPNPLPEVNESVVASDRFRYYQNVCTFSYSFVWWSQRQWMDHIEWMAMNGINLSLAPIDQEAAWATVYKTVGMTDEEIDKHFTGPAFLSWLRMGNIHGWAGPLLKSWHDRQSKIETAVTRRMFKLGMIPAMPTFSGHVPKAFARLFTNTTFQTVSRWNGFNNKYCCGLFLNPSEPLFKTIGTMFLREITKKYNKKSHIYYADPFNEVDVESINNKIINDTAKATYSVINEVDKKGVWLIQNWMFVNAPKFWTKDRVQTFFTAVPNGRLLILDLQAEHFPKYDVFEMYYGQPFIWCMLHNFGGTLGMIGKIPTINKNVYEVRSRADSTMIGIGLTPEGINQNYVVYDMMLETGWRQHPVLNLKSWVTDYAERRYGCNTTTLAWSHLLQSVYSYNKAGLYGYNDYIMTRKPSMQYNVVTAWYESKDLFSAFKHFTHAMRNCESQGFEHDLVDVTRQALQYRAEQIYLYRLLNQTADISTFKVAVEDFIDVLFDMEQILASNDDFTAVKWLSGAKAVAGANFSEVPYYELNARNQITLWGPDGEVSDYARKQWAELFHYYYIPRWSLFLSKAIEAKIKNEPLDEKMVQQLVRIIVEENFATTKIEVLPKRNTRRLAWHLYKKWSDTNLPDLPQQQ